ncbi:MaoC domain-containing protein dehydratase [Azoarcus sp. CIB]|uniref:dehydratase n=1 Tax=Aromatoleum sp. (strain CIB) TaxID=198107 RepID=UPI00067CCC1A|nr:dehydratase [Azoarcus sp. CIB]AKU11434.1 MaoC domain-containing protein dehydratase [Azoarcus sp. CIB]
MSATEVCGITAADIAEGQEMPALRHPVSATTIVLGALASRDWRPMHHDKDFAVERNGVNNIFINTPNNAAWFERYITDWTGPKGRLGRLRFEMKKSVFPGDEMCFSGIVRKLARDAAGCHWADLELTISVGDEVRTTGRARVAIPADAADNPWTRKGDRWLP